MCPAGESSRTAGHLPGVSAGFARQHVRAQTVLPRPVRTRLNLLSKRIVVPAHHASCVRTVNGRSTASPVAPRHYARLAGSRSAARAMTGQHAGHSADSSAAPSARRCRRRWQAAYQGACRGSRGGTGMETGEQPGEAMPRSPDVDAPPVVLVLVEDTTGSLASLLLAAEIAAAQQAHLHVAHVSAPRMPWGPPATLPGPAGMLIEADSAAAGELQEQGRRRPSPRAMRGVDLHVDPGHGARYCDTPGERAFTDRRGGWSSAQATAVHAPVDGPVDGPMADRAHRRPSGSDPHHGPFCPKIF